MQDLDPTRPETCVQRQLDAYNARDIDGFMRWWADDCQYFQLPDRLLARGAVEVRERHVTRFREPNLHGHLVKRMVVADIVVDQEVVTRTFPDGPGEVDVVAIYQVTEGKISNAWFRMGPPRLLRDERAAELARDLRLCFRGDDAGVDRCLRRAGPDDAAAVRDLTRAAYAKWVPAIGREPRPMTADYGVVVRDHLVDLLLVGGEIVALIETTPEADHLLIVNVAVAPAHRGQGYGRALMAHAERVAASLHLSEVRLYTNGRFTENLLLYRRLGYGVDREEQHPLFGATTYMSKRVSGDEARRPHAP